MKDKPVKKDLVSRNAARSSGNEPSLEGFAKAKVGEKSTKGERRMRRHSPPLQDDGESRRQVWMFMGGLVVFVVIGLVVYAWGKYRFGDQVASSESHNSSRLESGLADGASQYPLESLAEDVVRKAMACSDARLVGDSFRMMGDTRPADVIGFLKSMTARDGLIVGLQAEDGVRLNGQALGRVWVRMDRGGVETKRLAYLVHESDGVWKVDFDSFARLVKPGWDELTQMQEGKGVVRVVLMPTYDAGGEWNRYFITSPDLSISPLAFSRKGSEEERQIAEALRSSSPHSVTTKITLGVSKNKNLPSSAFEITEVLADGWVVPDDEELEQ